MKIGDPKAAQQLGLDHISTQVPSKSSIEDTPEAIMEAARTFESLFLNEIMKNMRKTLPQDGLLNKGFANNVFNSMLDQEYSQIASKSGQLGLAEVIARQLGGDPSEIAQREAKESSVDKVVTVDGEEVPAWALEEIPADPWSPATGSKKPNPTDSSVVTPGLSAPSTSEFSASRKAIETYQLLSQTPNKKR